MPTAAPAVVQPQSLPQAAGEMSALLDRLYLATPGPALSVVVPTRNERDNVIPLYNAVSATLAHVDWEIIFVDDDSNDGTPDAVHWLARHDRRVRLIRRLGRRGLSSACVEGMQASTAPFVAVMDADLQHDETLLPRMLEALESDPGDYETWFLSSRLHTGQGQIPEARAALAKGLACPKLKDQPELALLAHLAGPADRGCAA